MKIQAIKSMPPTYPDPKQKRELFKGKVSNPNNSEPGLFKKIMEELQNERTK